MQRKTKKRHWALTRSQLIIIFAVYGFFLLALPSLNELATPCLKHLPGVSYTYADCNIGLTLDHYIALGIMGMAVMVLWVFWKTIHSGYKTTVVLALILALLTIGGYYLYIPKAEEEISNSPLVLESLLQK